MSSLTPEQTAETSPAENASPNELLRYSADHARRQTQGMKLLIARNIEAGEDLRAIRELLEQQERNWNRIRTYIAIAFWLFIGIPLVLLGVTICLPFLLAMIGLSSQ